MSAAAFPLAWPVGWPRVRARARAKFGVAGYYEGDGPSRRYVTAKPLTIAAGVDRLIAELQRLGTTEIVISTNVRSGRDGYPRGDGANPSDPGAAVYFRLKREPRVLACDKWDRLSDNLAALAKHIEAVRGQIRWGVGSLEQAFGGYKALPAMGDITPWWVVLGVERDAKLADVERRRRELLERHHPDRGGSHAMAAEINAAYAAARAELSP